MEQMKKFGYGVKWIDRYKYITYATPEGQAFRDNKLLDNRYLKTNMEVGDILGHSTSQITEMYYVKRDNSKLIGITDSFEM